jgi:hypothetical protein
MYNKGFTFEQATATRVMTFAAYQPADHAQRYRDEGVRILAQLEAAGFGAVISGRTVRERLKQARQIVRRLRDPITQKPLLERLPYTVNPHSISQQAIAVGLNSDRLSAD